jgi:hypothetical protein
MSNIPFPNREDRSLSMRDQIIARLRQLNPGVRDYFNEKYLATVKDFALLQALECAIQVRMDREYESQASYMFDAGIKYERDRIINNLSQGV